MGTRRESSVPAADNKPADVLWQLVEAFSVRGWLNRILRIRFQDKKYRVLCTEKSFIAYRINENYGISPGMPGWAVCIVDHNQILEDARMPNPSIGEPTALDWLHSAANGELEII